MSNLDNDNQQFIIAIESSFSTVNVSLTHDLSQQTTVWQRQSSITEMSTLLQRVNNSLAQAPQIDAIVHTIQQKSNSDNWQFGMQLCNVLPLALMIRHSLSYVVCIDAEHTEHLAIEAYFRKQSLQWANQRVRINCIRQQRDDSPSNTQRFLMGSASRVLTGALFLADGQMLMGGHPTAERIITQQCLLHQINHAEE